MRKHKIRKTGAPHVTVQRHTRAVGLYINEHVLYALLTVHLEICV
jgi:hypothetical protein